jgi:hypothetical protein
MALQKSEKRTLMIGGAALVIGLIWVLASGNKDKGKTASQTKAKTAVQKIANPLASIAGGSLAQTKLDTISFDKVHYASWGRDPFIDRKKAANAAAWKEKSEISNLTLKGLVRMGNTSYVMINDVILTVGQEKNGIYIESIEGNQVRCRKAGKTFTLEWKESS